MEISGGRRTKENKTDEFGLNPLSRISITQKIDTRSYIIPLHATVAIDTYHKPTQYLPYSALVYKAFLLTNQHK